MTSVAPSVIVLAADRGPGDPLAVNAGVSGKVLVEIAGKPMLTRVMQAVSDFAGHGRLVVVCRDDPAYMRAADVGCGFQRIDPGPGPAASAMAAMESLDSGEPVLLVTGDHPLLEPDWLEQFVARAAATGADAAVGLVDHASIVARFPESRRTRYRFSDISVCGTNLFWFSGPRGRAVVEQWRVFETHRKKPWKIVGRLGPWNLLRYLAGRLTLAAAMDALSRRMGLRLGAVLLDAPEAAVDVDSPADLDLAAGIIARREGARP